MKIILQYLRQYFSDTNWAVTIITSIITSLLIFCNFYFNIDSLIRNEQSFFTQVVGWFLLFLFSLAVPYLIYGIVDKKDYLSQPDFIFLLLLAPLIFAIRLSIPTISTYCVQAENVVWLPVINWTVSLVFITTVLILVWYHFSRQQLFYGIKKANTLRPYLFMLLCMLPLVGVASTLSGFDTKYPRLHLIQHTSPSWWKQVLFELSYGSDFFTIELFFRGFLVLAFAKWAGKDAILAMACFYCTIHFSKPLPECISSYFGGLVLGVAVYYSQSIWGGLLVHLGVAWAMELAGLIL